MLDTWRTVRNHVWMKTRIDAGTDIAMIGVWDVARNEQPLPAQSYRLSLEMLTNDAELGDVFLINTGSDGSWPVDIFVEEPISSGLVKHLQSSKGQYLLRVPSGRLVVGGAEDYRSKKARITDETSMFEVPAGDYSLRCYQAKDQEEIGADLPDENELRAVLGESDYRYYRYIESRSLRGYLILLAFPVLCWFLEWKIALAATLLPMIGYVHLQEYRRKKDERHARILKSINEVCRKTLAKGIPSFALEIRRVDAENGLKGGIVEIEAHAMKGR